MSEEEKEAADLEGGPPPEVTQEAEDQPTPNADIGAEPSTAGPEHGGDSTDD